MLELKITGAALFLGLVALLSPDQQAQTLIAAVMGAALGGYMGSFYFPGAMPGHITLRRRWAANLATGTSLGPLMADWLQPRYFPDSPLLFVTLATAAAIGALGVLLLTLIIPPAFRCLQNKFFPPPPKN